MLGASHIGKVIQMKNTLKEKLQNHQQPIGTFFELGSANVAEALGKTGLDFIIIDNEHGPFEAESTLDYVSPWRRFSSGKGTGNQPSRGAKTAGYRRTWAHRS